jgi:tryptophanyl-tRNA synthetase
VYAIHALIKEKASLDALYMEHTGKYKALKDALIDDLDAFIAPMRESYLALTDETMLTRILADGATRAKEKASEKMSVVKKTIGTS